MADKPRFSTRTKVSAGGAAGAAVAFGIFLSLVQQQEGTVLHSYKDPVGIWTMCTGHTGPDVKPGMAVTPEQCYALLDKDGKAAWNAVPRQMGDAFGDITYGQWIAFADFIVTAGEGNFSTSSMRRYALQGKQQQSCDALRLWIKADNGRVDCRDPKSNCPGIPRRREKERSICLGEL